MTEVRFGLTPSLAYTIVDMACTTVATATAGELGGLIMATKSAATKSRAKPRAKTVVKESLPAGYRRWDTVNHLRNDEDMAAYLEAAMEEAPDDAAYITAVLNDIARARGIMQLANDAGMTRAGLYKALAPGSKPSLDTIVKISKALGLRVSLQPAA